MTTHDPGEASHQDPPAGDPAPADATSAPTDGGAGRGDGDELGRDDRGDDAIDRRDPRLRTVAVILAVGLGLAVLGAVGVGVGGGTGRAGAAVLLLVLALSLAAGALVALGTALVDEFRGRPVGRARIVVGIVLFIATAAFMAMTAGIGG